VLHVTNKSNEDAFDHEGGSLPQNLVFLSGVPRRLPLECDILRQCIRCGDSFVATPGGGKSITVTRASATVVLQRDTIPYSVLVVSRRPDTLASVEDMLLKNGETVFTAPTIKQAWENLRIGRVGLVVLDLCEPTPEDLLLVSTSRAVRVSQETPFLFIKNKASALPALNIDTEDHIRDGWVDAPCQAQELTAAVTRLFQQRAYSRRMRQQARGSSGKLKATTSASGSGLQAGVSSAFEGIFNGKLGELDVPKLLGMLAPMNLTGVLTIKSEKRKGQIYLVNGAVWHAACAGVKGAEALFIVFRIHEGKFMFDVAPPPQERTIQSNTLGLLLEGLRAQDETKELTERARGA
jgi:CheY-like chemotaxis protein